MKNSKIVGMPTKADGIKIMPMMTDGMHIHIEHRIQTEIINGDKTIQSHDTGSEMYENIDDESIIKGYRQFAGSITLMLKSKSRCVATL